MATIMEALGGHNGETIMEVLGGNKGETIAAVVEEHGVHVSPANSPQQPGGNDPSLGGGK